MVHHSDKGKIRQKLIGAIDEYGATCLAEPFRILSGVIDEVLINHVATTPDDAISQSIKNMTLDHMRECKVLIVEDRLNSLRIWEHYFPWVQQDKLKSTVANAMPHNSTVTPDVEEYLRTTILRLETEVYEAAVRQMAEQLEDIKTEQFRTKHLLKEKFLKRHEWKVDER